MGFSGDLSGDVVLCLDLSRRVDGRIHCAQRVDLGAFTKGGCGTSVLAGRFFIILNKRHLYIFNIDNL